jgi:hypothetical protein
MTKICSGTHCHHTKAMTEHSIATANQGTNKMMSSDMQPNTAVNISCSACDAARLSNNPQKQGQAFHINVSHASQQFAASYSCHWIARLCEHWIALHDFVYTSVARLATILDVRSCMLECAACSSNTWTGLNANKSGPGVRLKSAQDAVLSVPRTQHNSLGRASMLCTQETEI